MLPLDVRDRFLHGACKTTKRAAVPLMTSMLAPVLLYKPSNDDWLEAHSTLLLVPKRRASGIAIMDTYNATWGAHDGED